MDIKVEGIISRDDIKVMYHNLMWFLSISVGIIGGLLFAILIRIGD